MQQLSWDSIKKERKEANTTDAKQCSPTENRSGRATRSGALVGSRLHKAAVALGVPAAQHRAGAGAAFPLCQVLGYGPGDTFSRRRPIRPLGQNSRPSLHYLPPTHVSLPAPLLAPNKRHEHHVTTIREAINGMCRQCPIPARLPLPTACLAHLPPFRAWCRAGERERRRAAPPLGGDCGAAHQLSNGRDEAELLPGTSRPTPPRPAAGASGGRCLVRGHVDSKPAGPSIAKSPGQAMGLEPLLHAGCPSFARALHMPRSCLPRPSPAPSTARAQTPVTRVPVWSPRHVHESTGPARCLPGSTAHPDTRDDGDVTVAGLSMSTISLLFHSQETHAGSGSGSARSARLCLGSFTTQEEPVWADTSSLAPGSRTGSPQGQGCQLRGAPSPPGHSCAAVTEVSPTRTDLVIHLPASLCRWGYLAPRTSSNARHKGLSRGGTCFSRDQLSLCEEARSPGLGLAVFQSSRAS